MIQTWISESVQLLTLTASTIVQEPFLIIAVLIILIFVFRLWRLLGG